MEENVERHKYFFYHTFLIHSLHVYHFFPLSSLKATIEMMFLKHEAANVEVFFLQASVVGNAPDDRVSSYRIKSTIDFSQK